MVLRWHSNKVQKVRNCIPFCHLLKFIFIEDALEFVYNDQIVVMLGSPHLRQQIYCDYSYRNAINSTHTFSALSRLSKLISRLCHDTGVLIVKVIAQFIFLGIMHADHGLT